MLLKALTSGGEVPWCTYIRLLNASHKDHATTIDTARLIQSLTAEVLPNTVLLQWLQLRQAALCHF